MPNKPKKEETDAGPAGLDPLEWAGHYLSRLVSVFNSFLS